jgi:hypothetical protein
LLVLIERAMGKEAVSTTETVTEDVPDEEDEE